jgi:hypothetical protein
VTFDDSAKITASRDKLAAAWTWAGADAANIGRNKLIMERVKLFANDLEQVIVSGSRVEGANAKVTAGAKK